MKRLVNWLRSYIRDIIFVLIFFAVFLLWSTEDLGHKALNWMTGR